MAYKSTYIKKIPAGSYRKKKEQQQPQIKVRPPQPEKSGSAIRIPTRQVASQQNVPRINAQSVPQQQRMQQIKIGDIAGSPQKSPAPVKINTHITTKKTKQPSVSSPSLPRDVSTPKIPNLSQQQQPIKLPRFAPQIPIATPPNWASFPHPAFVDAATYLKQQQSEVLKELLKQAYTHAKNSEQDNKLDIDEKRAAMYWTDLYNRNREKNTLTLAQVNKMITDFKGAPADNAFTKFRNWVNNLTGGETVPSKVSGLVSDLVYYLVTPALLGYAYQNGAGLLNRVGDQASTALRNALIPPKYQGILTLGNISTVGDTKINPEKFVDILTSGSQRALADTFADLGFVIPSQSERFNANPSIERQHDLQRFFKDNKTATKPKNLAVLANFLTRLTGNIVNELPDTIGPIGINKNKLLTTAQNMVYDRLPPETLNLISEMSRWRREGVRIPYRMLPTEQLPSQTVKISMPQLADPSREIASISTRVRIPEMLEGRAPIIPLAPPQHQPENQPTDQTRVEMTDLSGKDSEGYLNTLAQNSKSGQETVRKIIEQFQAMDETHQKKRLEEDADNFISSILGGYHVDERNLRTKADLYNSYAYDGLDYQKAFNAALEGITAALHKTVDADLTALNPEATPEQKNKAAPLLKKLRDAEVQRARVENGYKNDEYTQKYTSAGKLLQLQTALANANTHESNRKYAWSIVEQPLKDFREVYNGFIQATNNPTNKNNDFLKNMAAIRAQMQGLDFDYRKGTLADGRKLGFNSVPRLKAMSPDTPTKDIVEASIRALNIDDDWMQNNPMLAGLKRAASGVQNAMKTYKAAGFSPDIQGQGYPANTDQWLGTDKKNLYQDQYKQTQDDMNTEIKNIRKKKDEAITALDNTITDLRKNIALTMGVDSDKIPANIIKLKTQFSGSPALQPIQIPQQSPQMQTQEQLPLDQPQQLTTTNKASKLDNLINTGKKTLNMLKGMNLLPLTALATALTSGTNITGGAGDFVEYIRELDLGVKPRRYGIITTSPEKSEGQSDIVPLSFRPAPVKLMDYVNGLNDYYKRNAQNAGVITVVTRGAKKALQNLPNSIKLPTSLKSSSRGRDDGRDGMEMMELSEHLLGGSNYTPIGNNNPIRNIENKIAADALDKAVEYIDELQRTGKKLFGDTEN